MKIFKSHQNLSIIAPYLPENPVIVEAGAFIGKDTKRMAQYWPNATLHAFEPVPYLFQQLQNTTKDLPNVHCYPYALAAQNGTAPFYVSERADKPGIPNQAGSLRKPKERLKWSPLTYPSTLEVSTITLDTWAQQHGINHIDLVWLDVQGAALDILQAAPTMLASASVIFTEVEFIEAYDGQAQFDELKQWLEQHGFQLVAKNFENQERWFFGDTLFVRNP